MSKVEWLRTALAVFEAGSITAGAKRRQITQPAASQQLKQLERALGMPIFERYRGGTRATDDGARFLREIAPSFHEIDWVLEGLERGSVENFEAPIVVGCPPEWFDFVLLPKGPLDFPVRAQFDSDDQLLLDAVLAGRIDVAVTKVRSNDNRLDAVVADREPYLLVVAPSIAPDAQAQAFDVGEWIRSIPWVGFSEHLPVTRRFWVDQTGSTSPTRVALIAPDVRTVVAAVQRGLGASLVPAFACSEALENGSIVQVDEPLQQRSEPWVCSWRRSSSRLAEVADIVGSEADRVG